MGKGRGVAGGLAVALAVSVVFAAPAAAEDVEIPTCAPITFEDLGPALNESDPFVEGEHAQDESIETTTEETSDPSPVAECIPFVYSMGFPLLTPVWSGSVFGAIRDAGDRWHAGIDLAAPKLTPVVAVRDGVVTSLKRDPENTWIILRHLDGWSSVYVHLNNDTYGTDDGRGTGIRPDLDIGDLVEEGTVIGWVGDSGNAEDAASHLHFELREPGGMSVDPATSLRAAAARLEVPPMFGGVFGDDDDAANPDVFDRAVARGVPVWCDEQGLRGCPNEPATRADLVEWVGILLPDRLGPLRQTISDGAEAELFWIPSALGSVLGCESPLFCDQPVSGADLAGMLRSSIPVRTDACQIAGDETDLTREQVLRHLFRELGFLRELPCDLIS